MDRYIKADIIARVNFFKTEEGGRKGPTREDWFGCPCKINGKLYDCRLFLYDIGKVFPGDIVTVPIKFLFSKNVMAFLKVNNKIELWDGRVFASGTVEEILYTPESG